jgi:phage-related holin
MEKFWALLIAGISFVLSYFLKLGIEHAELYLATVSVILLDGVGGIMRAVKRGQFRTYRAIKTVKKLWVWILIISTILLVEKGVEGVNWLDETIITPFIVLELLSALKNFHQAGIIDSNFLKKILENVDNHKD